MPGDVRNPFWAVPGKSPHTFPRAVLQHLFGAVNIVVTLWHYLKPHLSSSVFALKIQFLRAGNPGLSRFVCLVGIAAQISRNPETRIVTGFFS